MNLLLFITATTAGNQLLDLDIHLLIRGHCDSLVLKTNVHFPTDISLTRYES